MSQISAATTAASTASVSIVRRSFGPISSLPRPQALPMGSFASWPSYSPNARESRAVLMSEVQAFAVQLSRLFRGRGAAQSPLSAIARACGSRNLQPTPSISTKPGIQACPAVPRPRLLDRPALLAAVAQAASATPAGADDSATQRALRRAPVRIPHPLRLPRTVDQAAPMRGWAGLRHRGSGTLRVRAKPTLGAADDLLVQEIGGEAVRGSRGFWIPRPWLLEPACRRPWPSLPPLDRRTAGRTRRRQKAGATRWREREPAAEPVPSWPRIGIAQFFTERDPADRAAARRGPMRR